MPESKQHRRPKHKRVLVDLEVVQQAISKAAEQSDVDPHNTVGVFAARSIIAKIIADNTKGVDRRDFLYACDLPENL